MWLKATALDLQAQNITILAERSMGHHCSRNFYQAAASGKAMV